MPIHLHIVYGCFLVITAELNNCDKVCVAHLKPKIFIIGLLQKTLPASVSDKYLYYIVKWKKLIIKQYKWYGII